MLLFNTHCIIEILPKFAVQHKEKTHCAGENSRDEQIQNSDKDIKQKYCTGTNSRDGQRWNHSPSAFHSPCHVQLLGEEEYFQ